LLTKSFLACSFLGKYSTANLREPLPADCLEPTFSGPVSLLNICPVCGSTIERVVVQNRGTCFCPRCQALSCGSLIQKWPRLELQQRPKARRTLGLFEHKIVYRAYTSYGSIPALHRLEFSVWLVVKRANRGEDQDI